MEPWSQRTATEKRIEGGSQRSMEVRKQEMKEGGGKDAIG